MAPPEDATILVSKMQQHTDQAAQHLWPRRQQLMQHRSSLPISQYRQQIIAALRASSVIIVEGETGSGKSTQLPQYIAEDLADSNTGKLRIGVTQPRRMPAKELAKRVAAEVGCQVGGKVGYKVRFENKTSDETMIKYMTDGILLQERLGDSDLRKYFCIILDEAHERSLNTDMFLPTLLETYKRRQNFKLVVCSASINSSQFVKYMKDKFDITAPVIRVPGRLYPVQIEYVMRPMQQRLSLSAIEVVLCIVECTRAGDILVFCPGQADIHTICKALGAYANEARPAFPLLVVPLHRSLPEYRQKCALRPTPAGWRKVVVATNIAEASITLDGVVFVVDMGTVMTMFFEPLNGFYRLQQCAISAGSAIQRAGRAGRTRPGKCFRLYTEEDYRHMHQSYRCVPEIVRCNLAPTLLNLVKLKVKAPSQFPFMNSPSIQFLATALRDLVRLNVLSESHSLTMHGEKVCDFPLEPDLANLLIASATSFSCSTEVMIIVAVIAADSSRLFCLSNNEDEDTQARMKIRSLQVPNSDHLTFLNVYERWVERGCSELWCRANYVQFETLQNASKIILQLERVMKKRQIPLLSCFGDYSLIKAALACCYSTNVAYRPAATSVYLWLALDGVEVDYGEESAITAPAPQIVICHRVIQCRCREPNWVHEQNFIVLRARLNSRPFLARRLRDVHLIHSPLRALAYAAVQAGGSARV